MKMHSPGQSSAASITRWCSRPGTLGQAAGPSGIVERVADLGHVGDAVLELDEHVGAVVHAQAVAGAQVLVDPHPHGRQATGRPASGPDRPGSLPFAPVSMPPDPPVAKRVPHVWERPTGPVEDPWAWLRDRDDPDTVAYLEAENVYADAWLEDHADLVDAIFDEVKARTQETDQSVPSRKGPWWFVSRTVEGLSYAIHCRGSSPETAGEQVLLDENERARDEAFFEVGAFDVSHDHRLLAWSADLNGHEVFTLRIRDIEAGVDLPDVIEGTYYGTAWSADGRHLFYTVPDHAMRPHQVWRHELGTSQTDDVLDPPGGRRALQRRPRAHPQRRVDRHHRRVHDLHGRPRPPGGPMRSARRARRAPPAGRGVPAGPLGRPLRHPHQPRRPGLQGGGCPVRGPRRRAVERPGRPRGRPADQPGRGLRRPPGAPRVGAGPRAAPHRRRRRQRTGALLRRTRPLGRHRDEPGVRDHHPPVRVRVAGDAALGLRGGRGLRRAAAAEAGAGARRLRPRRLPVGPRMGDGPGRHVGPGGRGVAPRHAARRHGRAVALRLRRLRVLPPAVVLDRPVVAARPGRRLGARPSARRRGARPGLVPGRQAAGQAQHLHRLHRLCRAPGGRGLRLP